ncbi:MAG: glycosyltransferase [Chryseolinea sp.]
MKIRVLHVIESLTSGGVEQRRLLLARCLDPAKFEQKVVCTFERGPLGDEIRSSGVSVFPIGKFTSLASYRQYQRLLRIIAEYRPHIIHGAVFEGVTLAMICGMLARVPVIIAEETSEPSRRTWRGNLLFRNLTKAADFVVGISPNVTRYLRNNKVAPHKICLINNGVREPRFISAELSTEIRARHHVAPTDFLLGTVGRLQDVVKRFSDVIRAVASLNETKIKILIVGEGNDRAMLEALAVECGIKDRVIFAGYQFDTAPYYACMDAFVLASSTEGFGLAIVEAMMFKLPVIATAVGGIPDIVVENETGLLVPAKSPELLAGKIRFLYENRQKGILLGENGYRRAKEHYTESVYSANVANLYQKAIQQKKVNLS